MGMIAELVKVISTAQKKRATAPGSQYIATATGIGKTPCTAEIYNPVGIATRPGRNAKLLLIPFGGGKTRVAIGGVNYEVIVNLAEGESALYSTTAGSETIMAQVQACNDGKIKIRNVTYSLKTILTANNNALLTFATALSTATSFAQINAAAATLITAINTNNLALAGLLKD